MNLDKFVEDNCRLCGSQRCNPYDPQWLDGCRIYREIKEKSKMFTKKPTYKYFTDGANKIVAVSSYAGKTVRGVAKCDPRDNFDIQAGKDLAQARCAVKIADKRYARAQKEYDKAVRAVEAAQNRLNKMTQYVADSSLAYDQAQTELAQITASL